jgi:hypothetical protein
MIKNNNTKKGKENFIYKKKTEKKKTTWKGTKKNMKIKFQYNKCWIIF